MSVDVIARKCFTLKNRHGWVLSYEVNPNNQTVTLHKRYKGDDVGDIVMNVEEARAHYAAQLRAGFVSPNTKF